MAGTQARRFDRNARNARTLGEAYAMFGRSIEDVADACGVDREWVRTFNHEGAASIARIAWEVTHDPYADAYPVEYMCDEGETVEDATRRVRVQEALNRRAARNLVRFARAARGFASTAFGTHTMPDVDAPRIVTHYEEGGNAESGPRMYASLVVVDTSGNVIG